MKIQNPEILEILKSSYPMKNGRFICIDESSEKIFEIEGQSNINRIKTFMKGWPRFYEFLRLFSPGISAYALTSFEAVKKSFGRADLGKKIIVNIGSGSWRVHPEVLNVDVFPLHNVDIIATAELLPFKDSSVDMVLCESLLEHVKSPNKVIQEIVRILKPKGRIYVTIPFLYPFHSSPGDYFRCTQAGLAEYLKDFDIILQGVYAGPAAALQGVLMHIFALLFSLGNNTLYLIWINFFRFLLSPLKLADFILNLFSNAHESAAALYFMGTKKYY